MQKYTKRPVTVEAVIWTGDNRAEAKEFCPNVLFDAWAPDADQPADSKTAVIRTLEGPMLASPGDFLIKGVAGEFYPCKPDIFRRSYTNEDGSDIEE